MRMVLGIADQTGPFSLLRTLGHEDFMAQRAERSMEKRRRGRDAIRKLSQGLSSLSPKVLRSLERVEEIAQEADIVELLSSRREHLK